MKKKLLGLILAMVMIITSTIPSFAYSNNTEKMVKIETDNTVYNSLDQMVDDVVVKFQHAAGENFATCETPSITFCLDVKVKADNDPIESGNNDFLSQIHNKHYYHKDSDIWSGAFASNSGWDLNADAETISYDNGIWTGRIYGYVNYVLTASQRYKFWDKFNKVIDSLDLDEKSDFEKVVAVYRWVASNSVYDANAEFSNKAYGALVDGKSACGGYAELLESMLNYIGIDTILINGYAFNGPHGWNYVKLYGKYYQCDATKATSPYSNLLTKVDINGDEYERDGDVFSGIDVTTLDLATENYTDQKIGKTDEETKQLNCKHNPINTGKIIPPTCTQPGYYEYVCSTCGAVDTASITDEAKLGHEYEKEHREPTCTEQGGDYYVCTRCGKVEKIENSIPATGHTPKGEGKVLVEARCGQPGLIQYTCAVCGETYEEETAPGEHSLVHEVYKKATCQEEGIEWDYCYGCWKAFNYTKTPKTEHDYDRTVVTQPTYTEKGKAKYTCSMCGDYYYEDIPALTCDHTETELTGAKEATCLEEGYTGDTVCKKCGTVIEKGTTIPKTDHKAGEPEDAKEATCTERGKTGNVRCIYCNKVLKLSSYIPELGHDWGYPTITKEATCTEDGVKTYTCTRCNETKTETIKATGHTWNSGEITKEPTCQETGIKTYTCTKCKETRDEVLEKVDHNWGPYEVTKEVTCTEKGVKTSKCSYCGQTQTKYIYPTGHDLGEGQITKEPTCTEDGIKSCTCSKCHETVEESISALGHDWNDGEITKEATCDDYGEKTLTCLRCGEQTSWPIDPLGHEKSDPVNVKKATCTEDGYTGDVYCTRCNELITAGEVIPKAGHKWDNGVITVGPSYTSDGVKTYTCTVCKTTKTESIPKLVKTSDNQNQNQSNAQNHNTSTSVNKPALKVKSIKLSGISKKIAAGKTVKLNAEILPENAENKGIKWISSNTKVATVSQTGLVKVNKKAGGKTVTITAISNDGSGARAIYKIKVMKGVVKKVSSIGAKNKTVKAGKTLKLKAKVSATAKANKKLLWTSNNEKYATVKNGTVKTSKAAKGKKVKITAMATDGSNKKATFTIKIK